MTKRLPPIRITDPSEYALNWLMRELTLERYLPHYETIRKFGKVFLPTPCPFQQGKKKCCFKNAYDLAYFPDDSDLEYVEGFAAKNNGGYPVHHAWVTSDRRNAIDPTWKDDPGFSYFGVVIPKRLYLKQTERTTFYDVFGHGNEHELERELFQAPRPLSKARALG